VEAQLPWLHGSKASRPFLSSKDNYPADKAYRFHWGTSRMYACSSPELQQALAKHRTNWLLLLNAA